MTSLYSEAGGKGDYDISGEVQMAVYYRDGHLVVHVNKARGLAAADSNGLSDPYVKTYLLPDKSKHSKKKTAVKRKTLDPIYDEKLKVSRMKHSNDTVYCHWLSFSPIQYKISIQELNARILWLSVWDWDRFGRNQFLGEVRLPISSLDLRDNNDHWHALLDKVR